MGRALLLTALLLLGCSSSTHASGPCGQRQGTYVLDYTERSGDCGPVSEQIVNVTGAPTVPSSCQGTATASADNCDVKTDYACPDPSAGTDHFTGDVTWSPDGSSGSGIQEITIYSPSGAVACESDYDVTITRH